MIDVMMTPAKKAKNAAIRTKVCVSDDDGKGATAGVTTVRLVTVGTGTGGSAPVVFAAPSGSPKLAFVTLGPVADLLVMTGISWSHGPVGGVVSPVRRLCSGRPRSPGIVVRQRPPAQWQ